jgi:DNA topoisomerase-1
VLVTLEEGSIMAERAHSMQTNAVPALVRALEPRRRSAMQAMADRLGLKLITTDALTIRRRRHGQGFSYVRPDGAPVRDRAQIRRLASLAVPPAYRDVLCAEDPTAHLQAIGRDAAGRLQYRYHPHWEKVREQQKARRLVRLIDVLPKIRRSVARYLAAEEPTRELVLAAAIDLVARSGIRPGSETYARLRGTRGAATLLKSNVAVDGEVVILSFRSKGGKVVRKEFPAPRLAAVLDMLRHLPGRRLFQYRQQDASVRAVTAREVNAFLREIAGVKISLKDFRTLAASAAALEMLARQAPAASERRRRRQVLDAVRAVAEDLANTPAVCRRSYVHQRIVTAFEDGVLEHFSEFICAGRSSVRREQLLARVMAITSDWE